MSNIMEVKDGKICWKKEKILLVISILFGLTIFAAYINSDVIKSIYHSFDEHIAKSKSSFWQLKSSALVLFYTPDDVKYNRWPKIKNFRNYKEACGCNLDGFEITFKNEQFSDADIVLFHGAMLPTYDEIRWLNKQRKQRSLWIYFVRENPENIRLERYYIRYFNLSVTYRLNSDIVYGYGKYLRKKNKKSQKRSNDVNFQTRTDLIAWAVSSCRKPRNKLAKIFDNYGMLSVTGLCKNDFKKQMKCKKYSCLNQFKKFKFYFAAENGFCDDYITEKYWDTALKNNLIPIVLGGANYSNHRLAIPGSFINVFDFKSPKELVKYIQKVSSNKTLYESYFEWQRKYTVFEERQPGCSIMLCNLYKKLVKGIHIKKRPLKNLISREKECIKHEKQYNKWINGK